jgi:hypothetical protein
MVVGVLDWNKGWVRGVDLGAVLTISYKLKVPTDGTRGYIHPVAKSDSESEKECKLIKVKFEITGKALQINEDVGLCPCCKADYIRITSTHGTISSILCVGCYERFEWSEMSQNQVICRALSEKADKQAAYDFGEIVEEAGKRFFVSRLEPC